MTKQQERILGNVDQVYLPILRQIFQDNLDSVILYGSAVKGMFTDGVSDVNVLILLKQADPKSVILLGKKAKSVMKKNRITPLLLTNQEFLGAGDIFPLEYLDILSSRKVIFGTDPTEELSITRQNLRHQVESQLRGTIGAFRNALLGSRGRSPALRRFLKEWFGSQNALIRGLLRLSGTDDIPQDMQSVAKALGELYSVDAGAIVELSRIRQGEKLPIQDVVEHMLLYLADVVQKVDTLDVSHDE